MRTDGCFRLIGYSITDEDTGSPYLFEISGNGAAYELSVTPGFLPYGMTDEQVPWTTNIGKLEISGTPTEVGTFTITLQGTDVFYRLFGTDDAERLERTRCLHEAIELGYPDEGNPHAGRQIMELLEKARSKQTDSRCADRLAEAYRILDRHLDRFRLGIDTYMDKGPDVLFSLRELKRMYRRLDDRPGTFNGELEETGRRV